ncbi:hypothetical protein Bpfe_025746, partial [Biomphalaria pfeifferi]
VQCSDERQYDICLSRPGVQETAEESYIDLRSSATSTRSIGAILRSTTSNGVQCSDERQYDICLSRPGVQVRLQHLLVLLAPF